MKALRPILLFILGGALGIVVSRRMMPLETLPTLNLIEERTSPAIAEAGNTGSANPRNSPGLEALMRSLAPLGSPAEDPSIVLARALDDAFQSGHEARALALLDEWVRYAPLEALAYIETIADLAEQQRWLGMTFQRWALHDPAHAWQAGLDFQPAFRRNTVLGQMLRAIAKQAPETALEFALSHPESLRDGASNEIFREWSQRDSKAALRAISELSRSQQSSAVSGYFTGRAEQDPAKALTEALAYEGMGSHLRQTAVGAVIALWSEHASESMLEVLTTRLDPDLRNAVAQQSKDALLKNDPWEVLAWSQEHLGGTARFSLTHGAILKIAAEDPHSAARQIETLPLNYMRGQTMKEFVNVWSETDPLAAFEWTRELTATSAQAEALLRAGELLAAKDLPVAMEHALALSDSPARDTLLTSIVESQAKTDAIAALSWISTLPPAKRPALESEIYGVWAEADPIALSAYLDRQSVAVAPTTAEAVVNSWAKQDAAAAAAWGLSQSDPEAQWRAVNRATGEWVRQDSFGASAWIAELPSGRAREEAVENIVESIVNSDPAAALRWIETMEEPARRDRWARNLIGSWSEHDFDAAQRALVGSTLPADEIAPILERITSQTN